MAQVIGSANAQSDMCSKWAVRCRGAAPGTEVLGSVLQAGDLVALHKAHDQEALRCQLRHAARDLYRPRQPLQQ